MRVLVLHKDKGSCIRYLGATTKGCYWVLLLRDATLGSYMMVQLGPT